MPLDQEFQHDIVRRQCKLQRICELSELLGVPTTAEVLLENFSNDEELDAMLEELAARTSGSKKPYWDPDEDEKPEPKKPPKGQKRSPKPPPKQTEASAQVDKRAIKTGLGLYINRVPQDAAMDRALTDGDRTMLLVLMIHCRNKDHCWPSEELLMKELPPCGGKAHIGLRTVQTRVANLKAAGYIEIIPSTELAARGYTHTTPGNTYRLIYKLCD